MGITREQRVMQILDDLTDEQLISIWYASRVYSDSKTLISSCDAKIMRQKLIDALVTRE